MKSGALFLNRLGEILLFLSEVLKTLWKRPCKLELVLEQVWHVTIQSFPTTAMAGFFVGGIMTVQFAMLVSEFGASAYLGGLATSATIREIGPMLIAFMLSGKVGAFTSAELGTMKVTEQIDAIRCLGADPIQEIILPRFLGIIISSFFLLTGGLMLSVIGGSTLGILFAGINPQEYVRHIPTILGFPSLLSGLVKCMSYALVLATICTFMGYFTTGGAKGVGRSVVSTSVLTMVTIVVFDWGTSFLGQLLMAWFAVG
ncbi:MAG: ABC transporter permease [Bdellovibrionaceae bacterium]|nr:ABC transporter permease [Pseudobdellovibrionaceae bacterium]